MTDPYRPFYTAADDTHCTRFRCWDAHDGRMYIIHGVYNFYFLLNRLYDREAEGITAIYENVAVDRAQAMKAAEKLGIPFPVDRDGNPRPLITPFVIDYAAPDGKAKRVAYIIYSKPGEDDESSVQACTDHTDPGDDAPEDAASQRYSDNASDDAPDGTASEAYSDDAPEDKTGDAPDQILKDCQPRRRNRFYMDLAIMKLYWKSQEEPVELVEISKKSLSPIRAQNIRLLLHPPAFDLGCVPEEAYRYYEEQYRLKQYAICEISEAVEQRFHLPEGYGNQMFRRLAVDHRIFPDLDTKPISYVEKPPETLYRSIFITQPGLLSDILGGASLPLQQ